MDQKIKEIGVVTVFTSPGADVAVGVGKVLAAEGFPVLEVTFRNEAAVDSIAAISKNVPDVIVGAGTVLTAEQAERAVEAGAEFCVSPGFSAEVGSFCKSAGVNYYPGVATAKEIQEALAAGFSTLKFFPAEASGGIPSIKALGSAFPSVRFMPTGGVNVGNVSAYLAEPTVIACGGSWLVPKNAVKNQDFEDIRRVARQTAAAVYGVIARDGAAVLTVPSVERTKAYLARTGCTLNVEFDTEPWK